MRKILMGSAFCLALSLGAVWANADFSATELLKVTGKVEVKKGAEGAFKAVPENLKLAGALKRLDSGDKVKTAEQSGAEMVLKDTCVMEIKEKSLFEVPVTMGQAALAKLRAQQGSFLFKVVTGSNFKVQTAEVIAGVKGTLFEVSVTDNLRSLISLPGVDIGLENIGGTLVNVYQGEVELTHSITGKRQNVKAGQGLAVLNGSLLKLDKLLAEGFGPLQTFKDPAALLGARFGEVGQKLFALPSSLKGLSGFSGSGLRMPVGIGGPSDHISQLTKGFAAPVMQKLAMVQKGLALAKEWSDITKNLKGEAFKPEFDESKFPVVHESKLVPENGTEEIHYGNGLFMAMAPNQGCQVLKLDPQENGMVLRQGEGTFHIRDFAAGIDGMVVTQSQGDKLLTVIQATRGTLVARIPGEMESVQVAPGRAVAFEFDPQAGKANRLTSAPALAGNPAVGKYRFQVENDLEAQRAKHNSEQNKKKVDAVQGALNKLNKGGKGLKIKKFWRR